MPTIQDLQAAIIDVAVAARIRANSRRIAASQVVNHGVDDALRSFLEDSQIYEESLREEYAARDKGLTMTRAIEILRAAERDIGLGA